MISRLLSSAMVALLFGIGFGFAHSTTTCAERLVDASQSSLNLSFTDFDQTPKRGWRALSETGCYAEAAELIHRYRLANPNGHSVLIWHQAQMEASAGSVENAISLARSTLRPEELESRSEFKWNSYVLGFIAFLEGKRDELQRNTKKLEESATKEAMNAPNLASLRRLLSCIGQPYSVASACSQ